MDIRNFDCGCAVRKETIGEKAWWNAAILAGSVTLLALARGGRVSRETQKIIAIGFTGAVIAIVTNQFLPGGSQQ